MNVLQQTLEEYRRIHREVTEADATLAYRVEPALTYLGNINRCIAEGKPIVWSWLGVPLEIFDGLDVALVNPEVVSLYLSKLPGRDISTYIDLDQLPSEFCSINRLILGLALSGDFPRPDLMIYAAKNPCDAAATVYSNTAHFCDLPSFFLDVPHEPDERGIKYVAGELETMVSFVEEHIGSKMDWGKVREAVGHSNEALGYLGRLLDLRKNAPVPYPSKDMMVLRNSMLTLLGTSEVVEWLKKRYETAMHVKEKGCQGTTYSEQRLRVAWIGNPPNYCPEIFDLMEEKYGAVVATLLQLEYNCEPVDNTHDVSQIFEGLAWKHMQYPMSRHGRMSTDFNIDEAVGLIKDYKVDAAILPAHSGCKWNWTSAYVVKEKVEKAAGVPVLNFEYDSLDGRFLSPEKLGSIITDFFEIRLGMKPH